ncbi:RAMP superfamily CRISPR-associated protein [Actinoalloteichus spitiensis]|uniref:RAMP superfamily CRISPR-associated protein n=1 Tax=Actinoalloteichus spitiensis TaxID=252394 RepID=UPI000362EAA3|nr:RAMP superfamily CRISPR-associated protein [Actinoalloteichus spitiensis]
MPFARVDPETFRRRPAGHALLGSSDEGCERYSGHVEAVWTNHSPLHLATGEVENDVAVFPNRRDSDTGEWTPFIPGSTVAGVVRNLHENLVGGCLRVFDSDFVPTYRDEVANAHSTAAGARAGWTLAQVSDVRHGRPRKLRLCDEVVWIESTVLADVLGGAEKVITGATVSLTDFAANSRGSSTRGRRVIKALGDVEPGTDWVLLVTDAAARDVSHRYYVAAGLLGKEEHALEDDAHDAWQRFLRLVEDTDDLRQARRDAREQGEASTDREREVRFSGPTGRQRLVGYRHAVGRSAYPGQVLWVRQRDGETLDFAASAIWRHPGSGAAGDRVPPELLACSDAGHLCPTCRVFGSVDAREAEPDADAGDAERAEYRARQRSYRGHLRFSDGLPLNEVRQKVRRFPMLSTPRPGAGQAYLDPRGKGQHAPEGEPALREWGSRLDNDEDGRGPRRFRGRKHYWLTQDYTHRPYFRLPTETMPAAESGAFGKESVRGRCLEPGARFRITVSFENLDLAELGGLLASLDPALVLEAADQAKRIGFGVGHARPLGLGSCTGEVVTLTTHTARSRYLGETASTVAVADAIAAFVEATDPGVRGVWPMLTSALTLDHVDPRYVYYPTKGDLRSGQLHPDDLEPDFEFWQESRGVATRKEAMPLTVLPDITAPAEAQFVPRARRTKLPSNGKGQHRKPSVGGQRHQGAGNQGKKGRQAQKGKGR